MKKHIIFLLIASVFSTANAATTAKPSTTVPVSAARSATTGRGTVARGTATQTSPTTTVAARAGTTQKVVSGGTKVATAATNTAVDATCTQKFNGCMDSFCMTENTSGGRCQCSNQNAQLAKQLEEIDEINQQSYKLATIGVETIETGIAISEKQASTTQSTRKTLDLSQWNTTTDYDDLGATQDKTGTELRNEAFSLCLSQIPECASSASMLQSMYNQHIRSDCSAYENAIKQELTAAENRLAEAQRAMRSSAYTKLQESNKYDLGQCTIEYKKCMISTGGCGDDFKGCVSIAAAENAKVSSTGKSYSKTYDIKGSATKISIAASSYDILESKKPLCDSILNSCQAVKDQVWTAFLREAAPQIKTAELLAESDLRTSCISNISECFQKACKDTMDPNDPDGSYDMCLSRPETVRSLCKVQIDPCEKSEPLILDYVYARLAAMRVDACTTEVKQCLQSDDRCGKDYTQCVGLDTDTIIRMCPYDKLVGCQKVYKDTDIRGDAVYDELANMVQGIMLGIDNNMLEFCQNAANESMIRICGDTENCSAFTSDDHIGAGSLEYKICEYTFDGTNASIDYSKCRTNIDQITDVELGRVPGATNGELGPITPFTGLLDGMMFWELITVNDDGNLTGADEYFELSGSTAVREEKRTQISDEIQKLQHRVNNAIATIESDPTVQYCMTGRKVQGMKSAPIDGTKAPRFPQLTKQMRSIIAAQALKDAKENYYKSYDEKYDQLAQDYVKIAERQAEIKGENAKDARREAARLSCISLADMASLPMSPPPPGGWGMWLVVGVVVVASVVVSVFTFGAGAIAGSAATSAAISAAGGTGAIAASTASTLGATAASLAAAGATAANVIAAGGTAIGAAAVGAASASLALSSTIAIAAGATAGATLVGGTIAQTTARKNHDNIEVVARELSGHHELNQWNWKQEIDTTFEWDSLKCTKCVKSTKCIKQSYPLFGKPKCKQWAASTTECTENQF